MFVDHRVVPAEPRDPDPGLGRRCQPVRTAPRAGRDAGGRAAVPPALGQGRRRAGRGGAAAESQRASRCRIVLVGIPDPENPKSIPEATVEAWQAEGVVEWWGQRDDMPEVLAKASIVALPSYREGVPKALLEGAAAGRPLVATDVPGCREIVRPGENGLLVPPRDAAALGGRHPPPRGRTRRLRSRMGARSREIAVAEFSEEIVIRQTLAVYRDLLGDRWPATAGAGVA